MSQLRLLGGEDSRRSSMTTLSSMNTIYAAGSLFSHRPPPPRPPAPHRPRALATFRGSRLLPPSSVSAFYLLNQERCSPSIANRLGRRTFITRWLQVGAAQTWETRERAGEETSRPTTPALEKLVQTMGELIRISTAYLIMFQLIFSVFVQMIYLERGFIKAHRTDLFVNLHNIFFFF